MQPRRLSRFFVAVQTVIFTVLFSCSFSRGFSAQGLPDEGLLRYAPSPVTEAQESAQQLLSIERCTAADDHSARNAASFVVVSVFFGAFSALWAQKTGRNAFLWFTIGFALNLVAVFLILWLHFRKPKKRVRRYRHVKDYWTLTQG